MSLVLIGNYGIDLKQSETIGRLAGRLSRLVVVGEMTVEVFLDLRMVALTMRERDPDSMAVIRDPCKARRRNNPLPPGEPLRHDPQPSRLGGAGVV